MKLVNIFDLKSNAARLPSSSLGEGNFCKLLIFKIGVKHIGHAFCS